MKSKGFVIEEMQDILQLLFVYFPDVRDYEEEIPKKEWGLLLQRFLEGEALDKFHYALLRGNKKQVDQVFRKFYELAEGEYEYYENDYPRFGASLDYLAGIDPVFMLLAAKYFALCGEKEKESKSYLIALCVYASNIYGFGGSDMIGDKFLELCEEGFGDVRKMLYPDWLALHPTLANLVGCYCLKKRKYEDAFGFFERGSGLDYEGRQSVEPFERVGKNTYELGMMYLNGQYVERDYGKALELFCKAADEAGEPCIPIIGDMYYFGYGVEKDEEKALKAYASFNEDNVYSPLYYRQLNREQRHSLEDLCRSYGERQDLTYEDFELLHRVYLFKIPNRNMCEELLARKLKIIQEIPTERRDERMERDYVDYVYHGLWEKLREPEENTGFIPSDLKVGDVFVFGQFNGEPLEWKAWEINEDGSIYVVSTRIVAKAAWKYVFHWLNNDFFGYCFSKEEKKHIVGHRYPQFLLFGKTYLYLPSSEQFMRLEGEHEEGAIQETEFAKSLASSKNVLCGEGSTLLPNGKKSRERIQNAIEGIRPAMDITK